jgi:hypothetical protein
MCINYRRIIMCYHMNVVSIGSTPPKLRKLVSWEMGKLKLLMTPPPPSFFKNSEKSIVGLESGPQF